ncbi:unnamed protein product [Larinioides sclopetarius]|uniref:Uncharacterized protein n=1 Tax=Larinioides sclopetarius TaxID=280406 RepID=A0AAV2BDT2_9ARAC
METNFEDFKITDEETSNGHNIHYSFPVRKLVVRQSWPLVSDYNIDCSLLPTSWKLGISYEQLIETGKISCLVSLTRTDRINNPVEVIVKVSVVNEKTECLRWPSEICSSQRMRTDEMIKGSFEDSRDPGLRSYVLSLDLFLRVTILVRSCHFTENFDRQRYFKGSDKGSLTSKK